VKIKSKSKRSCGYPGTPESVSFCGVGKMRRETSVKVLNGVFFEPNLPLWGFAGSLRCPFVLIYRNIAVIAVSARGGLTIKKAEATCRCCGS
jgi:hypothetical protein